MKDWPSVALGEIFEIARGGSPRPIQNFLTEDSDGVNWVMISDASEGSKYITKTKKKILKSGVKKSRMVHPGDFVLTNSMSFGHPYIMQTSGCIHDGWLVLSNKDKNVDQDYFYHLLGSDLIYSEFSRLASGSTVKNLNIQLVKGVRVPLPPIAEQRRIAAILDKADAIRRKRKQAIQYTEELLRATFLDMFGDLFAFVRPGVKKHPKGFTKGILGDQITLQRGFDITKSQCQEGPIPVISSGGTSAYHSEAKAPGPGVLLGRKGSVGRVHYVESDYWPHDTTLWVREFNKNNPVFIYYFFKNFPISNFEESTSNPTLNRNRLHPLEVFWPPIEIQEKFSDIFSSTMKLQCREEANLAKSDNLFNSLLQRAFRGEL